MIQHFSSRSVQHLSKEARQPLNIWCSAIVGCFVITHPFIAFLSECSRDMSGYGCHKVSCLSHLVQLSQDIQAGHAFSEIVHHVSEGSGAIQTYGHTPPDPITEFHDVSSFVPYSSSNMARACLYPCPLSLTRIHTSSADYWGSV